MFLIKNIHVNNMERRLYVEDGLKAIRSENHVNFSTPNFWGNISLNSGTFPHEANSEQSIISFDEYVTRPIRDGFIELCLFDDGNNFLRTDTDNELFVNYLILIEKAFDDIKTNAKRILFQRYHTGIVAILEKDGDYIEVDGFRLEYENKKVFYKTYI